jgi:hypothetical protein
MPKKLRDVGDAAGGQSRRLAQMGVLDAKLAKCSTAKSAAQNSQRCRIF